jgi:hypothetical protein
MLYTQELTELDKMTLGGGTMRGTAAVITHPIALCAYVVALVFGLIARKWNSRSRRKRDQQLFYLAVSLSVVALVGGLFLAWSQLPKPVSEPTARATPEKAINQSQTSLGDQSPNVSSSGNGSVTVQIGPPTANQPTKPEVKKK